jgi:PleD family two-component response regulator
MGRTPENILLYADDTVIKTDFLTQIVNRGEMEVHLQATWNQELNA